MENSISKLTLLKIRKLQKLNSRTKAFKQWQEVKKVLLLVDRDVVNEKQVLEAKKIIQRQTTVFNLTKDKKNDVPAPVAFKTQFLFFQNITGPDLTALKTGHFDLALVYEQGALWALTICTAMINADLIIGSGYRLANFADLIIVPRNDSLPEFVSQTKKYLNTIKMAKNGPNKFHVLACNCYTFNEDKALIYLH